MKTLLLLLTGLLIGQSSLAQTSVIRTRSHSGDVTTIKLHDDNFGLDPSQEQIYKANKRATERFEMAILINDHCYVHYRPGRKNETKRDTVCNSRYFEKMGYYREYAQKYFGKKVVLSGFPKAPEEPTETNSDTTDGADFWINGSPYRNGISGLLLIIFGSLLLYIFTPIFIKK